MPKYVAFLRAINVGGHTVKMDQLRRAFTDLGFANVETFIASGNVIFDSKQTTRSLALKIEKHLQALLGYEVATFVRSTSEVKAVAAYQPFEQIKNAESGTVFVGFMAREPEPAKSKQLLSFNSKQDIFEVKEREVYWLRFGGFADSKFSGAVLEKTLGLPMTLRNTNTVQRIAARY